MGLKTTNSKNRNNIIEINRYKGHFVTVTIDNVQKQTEKLKVSLLSILKTLSMNMHAWSAAVFIAVPMKGNFTE